MWKYKYWPINPTWKHKNNRLHQFYVKQQSISCNLKAKQNNNRHSHTDRQHIYKYTWNWNNCRVILINDITDHLPVFAIFIIFHHFFKTKKESSINTCKLVRHTTPEAAAALKMDLRNQTWSEVYANDDPNKSYDAFLITLLELYDKHCPVKKLSMKNNDIKKPWITKGIENAWKRKIYYINCF